MVASRTRRRTGVLRAGSPAHPGPRRTCLAASRAAKWSSSRHCETSTELNEKLLRRTHRPPGRARPSAMRVSASSRSSRSMSAGSAATPGRSGYRKRDGCGSAGRVPFPPRSRIGSPPTGSAAGTFAFAAIPEQTRSWHPGEVVGIDRGVAVSAVLSTGQMLCVPRLSPRRQRRLRRLQRKLARARRGSNRRRHVKAAIARLRARETDARKDWAQKVSTDLARRFDVIYVEDLRVTAMTRSARGTRDAPGRNVRQKSGLNREILRSGWGTAGTPPGRQGTRPDAEGQSAFTSQRCSACGHIAADKSKSQALFACVACGEHLGMLM